MTMRTRSTLRWLRVLVPAALVVGGLSCSGGGDDGGDEADVAAMTFGPAPRTDGSVTYQPDVVIVGGGADSVVAKSDDGLVYTIDDGADRIDHVEVGKVMYVTSRVVGRVLEVEEVDRGINVTLGPVELTEIFEDAHFEFSGPVDIASGGAVVTPELVDLSTPIGPSAPENQRDDAPEEESPSTTESAAPGTIVLPEVRFIAGEQEAPSRGRELTTKFTSGNFTVEAYVKSSGYGAKIGHKANGMALQFDFGIRGTPQVTTDLTIEHGKLTNGGFDISGLTGVSVGVVGASESGQRGNFGNRIEFPVEFVFPLQQSGIPAQFIYKDRVIIETAFSAKNSTLEGRGDYTLSGSLGFDVADGKIKLHAPTVAVKDSFLQSLSGIGVGYASVVVAFQQKLLLGFGIPEAAVGPFGSLTMAVTGTAGPTGVGIVQCHQASLDVVVGGGVGWSITPAAASLFARLGITKIEGEAINTAKYTVARVVAVKPKLKICGA
jgi:hypothetical protein